MPQRFKRDYQDDPKDYLDKVIEHWIYKIPVLIDIAVAESEKDLRLTVAKRVTQVNFAQILSFLSSQTYDKILWRFGLELEKQLKVLNRSSRKKEAWRPSHFL